MPTTCVRWSWCFSFFLSLICFRKSVGTDYFENFLNKGPVIICRLRGAEDFFWGRGRGTGSHGFQEKEGDQPLLTGTKGGPGKKRRKLFEAVGSIYYFLMILFSGCAYVLNVMLKNVYVL